MKETNHHRRTHPCRYRICHRRRCHPSPDPTNSDTVTAAAASTTTTCRHAIAVQAVAAAIVVNNVVLTNPSCCPICSGCCPSSRFSCPLLPVTLLSLPSFPLPVDLAVTPIPVTHLITCIYNLNSYLI